MLNLLRIKRDVLIRTLCQTDWFADERGDWVVVVIELASSGLVASKNSTINVETRLQLVTNIVKCRHSIPPVLFLEHAFAWRGSRLICRRIG